MEPRSVVDEIHALDFSKLTETFAKLGETLSKAALPAFAKLKEATPKEPSGMAKYKRDRAKARKAKRKHGGHK